LIRPLERWGASEIAGAAPERLYACMRRIPKYLVRSTLTLLTLLAVWLFIDYPSEVMSAICAVLFAVAALDAITGPSLRGPGRKGKDRTFRHPLGV